MTPEERASKAAFDAMRDRYVARHPRREQITAFDSWDRQSPEVREDWIAAIRAAVVEEREAIKKLVATHLNDSAQSEEGISADRTAASILYEIEQRSGVPTYDPVEMPK